MSADRPIAFVDCETTGLDPDLHEIWEVSLGTFEDDGAFYVQTWQLPVDLGRADPMALKIGRFHERRVVSDKLTSPSQFAVQFDRRTRGLHLVGAVVSFDEERLRRLLRREHRCPMWHYHIIDVEAMAVGWLAARGMPVALPWNSEKLSRAVGVDPDEFDRHTSEGDVRWALAIYTAMREDAS